MRRVRLVTFDALHTIIIPRKPIYIQYAEVFSPYFDVSLSAIKPSFKTALKQLQVEKPVYAHTGGVEGWWTEVVKRTAIGAGADPQKVGESLHLIVPTLMKRFSSSEGYKAFSDVHPTLEELANLGIRTGVVSNADSRIRSVLADLDILSRLDFCILSEEVGFEKPSQEIWEVALKEANMTGRPEDVLHVGDELEADYFGAKNAGLEALLLKRTDDPEAVTAETDGNSTVEVINHLRELLQRIRR